MSQPYYKRKDALLRPWLINLRTVATANMEQLGLDVPDLDVLIAADTNFSTAYNEALAARLAAETATMTKDSTRRDSLNSVKSYVKTWQASTTINQALKNELDLPIGPNQGVPTPPTVPLDFVATPNSNGSVAFRWKRNGNRQGTVFVIEKFDGSEWETIELATKTRVTVNGFAPGVSETFRVFARRNGQNSAPSDTQTIYGDSNGLSLAA